MTEEYKSEIRALGIDVDNCIERCCSKEDLLQRLLKSLFKDKEMMNRLKSSMEEKDYKKAFDISHGIKGAAGNLGINTIYDSCCLAVEAFRSEDYSNIDELVDREMKCFMELEQVVRKHEEE